MAGLNWFSQGLGPLTAKRGGGSPKSKREVESLGPPPFSLGRGLPKRGETSEVEALSVLAPQDTGPEHSSDLRDGIREDPSVFLIHHD